MAQESSGVELRDKSIRIGFSYQGEWCRETLKIKPTEANRRYAENLVARIRKEIDQEVFNYADHFPDSKKVGVTAGSGTTLGQACEAWLETKGRLAPKTKNQYRNATEVWARELGASKPLRAITHDVIARKVGGKAWASPKLLNNYLICLRGVFKLALRSGWVLSDPTDGIGNSKVQLKAPDPLSAEEASKVLAWLKKNAPVQVWAYFLFAIATGMRPEEIIALRDEDIAGTRIHVRRARSNGKLGPLKTHEERWVDLTAPALQAIKAMKGKGVEGFIFSSPTTGKPWHDERSQRDHYWTPALKALGIRHRRAYCTRHTYATMSLAAGANPGYVARQLGHRTTAMLFRVYSRWIEGSDGGSEAKRVSGAMSALLEIDK
jgi:integrase